LIFSVLREKNAGVVEVAFLKGFLRFWGVFWMVNRGEVVVICVANVVFLAVTFLGSKNMPTFRTLFLAGPIRCIFSMFEKEVVEVDGRSKDADFGHHPVRRFLK
jgi:hypothetical protein